VLDVNAVLDVLDATLPRHLARAETGVRLGLLGRHEDDNNRRLFFVDTSTLAARLGTSSPALGRAHTADPDTGADHVAGCIWD